MVTVLTDLGRVQQDILVTLAIARCNPDENDYLSGAELASRITNEQRGDTSVSRQNVYRNGTRLLDLEWVTRDQHPHDGRQKAYQITDDGYAAVEDYGQRLARSLQLYRSLTTPYEDDD